MSQHKTIPELPGPIEAEGTCEGIRWAVMRHSFGHCNGYVQLPEAHPWLNREFLDVDSAISLGGEVVRQELVAIPDIAVHGGITQIAESGWIGFDTMHAFDVWPGAVLEAYAKHPASSIWTVERVVREVESLARQAARAVEAGVFEI